MTTTKLAYAAGARLALHKLGMDAESFVEFAKQDPTDQLDAKEQTPTKPDEKPVHWSNAANIQSGDTGTRNEQMGLPRNQGI